MSNYFEEKMKGKSAGEIVGLVILAIIGITGLFILFGFVIMWLWNWLMPDLFGLTTITFWQGMGLCLLAKIFFGGFGGGGSSNKKSHHKKHSQHKHKFKECEPSAKGEISKWKMYDKFWEEEGNSAFEEYVAKRKSGIKEEE